MNALLSSAYFGPVQWYQKLHRYNKCIIEQYDNYTKQTYRNRCIIAASDGPLALTVPVKRSDKGKQLMRDTLISDHGEWRKQHWNAITSAYGQSPYFKYYADSLRPFFLRRYKFLIDMNTEITRAVCSLIGIQPDIMLSENYVDASDADVDDFRDAINPKHPASDPTFSPLPYYQVHARKDRFLPNMSIIDLLMNEGPEAIFFL